MDMDEDDGTREAKRERRLVILALLVVALAALGWGSVQLYEAMRPLEIAKRLLRAHEGERAIPHLMRAIARGNSAEAMRRLGRC